MNTSTNTQQNPNTARKEPLTFRLNPLSLLKYKLRTSESATFERHSQKSTKHDENEKFQKPQPVFHGHELVPNTPLDQIFF